MSSSSAFPDRTAVCVGSTRRSDQARRVRDVIRTRLLQDDFVDGRLPDEAQLMIEHRVGRNVVREALALLQSEGLISRTQGVGTMSLTQKTRIALHNADGLAAAVGAPARVITRVISTTTQPVTALIAQRLEVDPGAPCLAVDVTTFVDGEPAVLLTSYVAEPDARRRMVAALGSGCWMGDWYELLASVDLRPVHRDTITEAVCLDRMVAPLLDAADGAPAMRVERKLLLGDHEVAEFGYSYSRGDRIVFAMSDGRLSVEVCT